MSAEENSTLTCFILGFLRDESGQELIEYALIILAVLLATVAGSQNLATVLTGAVTNIFTKIQAALP